jgi:hypothetical protein
VTRIAKEGDPAVKISRQGVRLLPFFTWFHKSIWFQNDVVKLAHELKEAK